MAFFNQAEIVNIVKKQRCSGPAANLWEYLVYTNLQ